MNKYENLIILFLKTFYKKIPKIKLTIFSGGYGPKFKNK